MYCVPVFISKFLSCALPVVLLLPLLYLLKGDLLQSIQQKEESSADAERAHPNLRNYVPGEHEISFLPTCQQDFRVQVSSHIHFDVSREVTPHGPIEHTLSSDDVNVNIRTYHQDSGRRYSLSPVAVSVAGLDGEFRIEERDQGEGTEYVARLLIWDFLKPQNPGYKDFCLSVSIYSFDREKVVKVLKDFLHLRVSRNQEPFYEESVFNLVDYRGLVRDGNLRLASGEKIHLEFDYERYERRGEQPMCVSGYDERIVVVRGSLDRLQILESGDAYWLDCWVERDLGYPTFFGKNLNWYEFKRYQLRFPDREQKVYKEMREQGFIIRSDEVLDGHFLTPKHSDIREGIRLLQGWKERVPESAGYQFERLAPLVYRFKLMVE